MSNARLLPRYACPQGAAHQPRHRGQLCPCPPGRGAGRRHRGRPVRAVWDGATLRDTTEEKAQETRDPAVVLQSHITPSDRAKYVGESEAAGGSYNRILPFLLGSVPMLDDDRVALSRTSERPQRRSRHCPTSR